MAAELQRKIDFALKLLRSIPTDAGPVEVAFSGGKDSECILELAKMAGISFRAIYKNSTIDPPGTVAHCRRKGAEIVLPKMTFFDIVKKKGMPTQFRRVCCDHLKEYMVTDRAILGVRRAESPRRAARYKEPEVCMTYPHGRGKGHLYLPLLEWSDKDVEEFIAARGIECHPLYYDEQGNFHVERRLGCIGCPLRSDRGIADFKKYPVFLKQLLTAQQAFINARPSGITAQRYGNAYNLLFKNLFCRTYAEFEKVVSGGLFPELDLDVKKYLEEYFQADLTIRR